MRQVFLAALCSALVATSSLQAAAAPRHMRTLPSTTTNEQLRDARASLAWPDYQTGTMTRGNAGAAPAGR